MHKKYTPYLIIAPFFLLYFMFHLFPIVFSFIVSFTSWTGAGERVFTGFENYIRLAHDELFFKSVWNTLLIMIIALPLQLVTGLFMAAFLKDYTNKLRPALQLVNFLPYLTTPVAIGMLFQLLFEWKYGTINEILVALGLTDTPFNWLGEATGARIVIVILTFWRIYGYMMVMFLTGLSTIPNELYEAAKVDGATWIKSFRHITLPMLKPIMTFVVTMSIIGGWKLFDEPKILFSTQYQPTGGPERAVLTIVMNFYDTAFRRFEFGYGAAMAYGLFVIIFVFSLISLKIMNRGESVEE